MRERRSTDRRSSAAVVPVARPMLSSPLYDRATGLATKELFRDRTVHALSRAARTESRVGLLVLDVGPPFPGSARDRRNLSHEVLRQVRPEDTAAWLDDRYIGILVEEVEGWANGERMRRRLDRSLSTCRGSSVAVSDPRGRIHSWFGDSRNAAETS